MGEYGVEVLITLVDSSVTKLRSNKKKLNKVIPQKTKARGKILILRES
ncbi:hypothetical protein PM10SUCC1_29070 [Propionigenium maris DSM 9537]|uniref:Uncharacterized protein n=1 Tax=Propionigenium maris DSM 9537 TaxID=1123000 RepID=A0A9W6LP70_9FUSO|nr:hypothetical protein PM10SUCC1_29070 [Propionigenium maris DSM 9537]